MGMKCQFKTCPKDVTDPGSSTPAYPCATADDKEANPGCAAPTATMDNQCSGHGSCNIHRGYCECNDAWFGPHCGYKKCPAAGPDGALAGLHTDESPVACSGRGACIARTPTNGAEPKALGECKCAGDYEGEKCELQKCYGGCTGQGECDQLTGLCQCNEGSLGGLCCWEGLQGLQVQDLRPGLQWSWRLQPKRRDLWVRNRSYNGPRGRGGGNSPLGWRAVFQNRVVQHLHC